MKTTDILRTLLLFTILGFFCLPVSAQGVIICTKNGNKIKIPEEELDSITYYTLDESEGEEIINDVFPFNEGMKRLFFVNGVSLCMVPVKAGTYSMGSGYKYRGTDEYPEHKVTLTNDYYIGECEVTQGLWKAVTGTLPDNNYGNVGRNYPVTRISYEDVLSFISQLNKLTGENFRLPTEAEWEYAARGGNKSQNYTYSGGNGISMVGWYYDNNNHYGEREVKGKNPNELDIYDMSGNVSELCSDWYDEKYYSSSPSVDPLGPDNGLYRVIRGGDYFSKEDDCRVAARNFCKPTNTASSIGFRLALTSQ